MTEQRQPPNEQSSVSSRVFISRSSEIGPTGVKPPTGVLTTFMHMVKGFIGTGIFAMGEAFKFSGYAFGIILMALLAIINLHCQHLLLAASEEIASLESEEVKPSFAETVEYSMELSSNKWLEKHSHKFGITTNVFLMMAELGFCCIYFVFIAEHIVEITSTYGFLKIHDIHSTRIMLALVLGPMWLSTFLGNLKLLLPLSLAANVMSWIGIIMIMYFTLKDGVTPNEKRHAISDCSQIHRFFCITIYSFEGISFVIPLRNEMAHPKKFVSSCGVLNISMIFVAILYCLVGFLGYWKYGEKVESSIFLNLPPKDKLAEVTKGLICVVIMMTFTLHMYVPFEITYPLFYRKFGPFKYNLLIKCIYRSMPVLLTFTLANVIPFLGLFISLIGATTGTVLAIITPPVLELALYKQSKKKRKFGILVIVKDVIIIIIGTIACLGGTALSIKDIVDEFTSQHSKK